MKTKAKSSTAIMLTLFLATMTLIAIPVRAHACGENLEGPVFMPPPRHYKTLEMMLAEAGLAEPEPVTMSSPPPVPVTGTREILVLLVEFSDVAHDPTHTVAYFEDRFFDTAPPSVRDYYDEVSYGSFTYAPGAVMGWYPSTSAQGVYIPYTVFFEAIEDVNPFFDFGPYDTDNNGVVENEELTLFMIVSGDQGGAYHAWDRPNVATGDTNALGNPVSVEGEYSATHEFRSIGTYCHELGHDLGLPDLYDTESTVPGIIHDSAGIGYYGVMGMGYDWFGILPISGISHMTAWSKIQLGWITPTVVTESGYYEVHDAETNAEAYVLVDPDHTTDEYFLIENRHPANSYYESIGWPTTTSGTYPDEGIVIYHIDDTKIQDWINFGTNNVNVDETHKGVDVECADSPTSHVMDADDLDNFAMNVDRVVISGNPGDSNDLWDSGEYDFHDGSIPCNAKWYGEINSRVDIRNLPPADPTMRVYLSVQAYMQTTIIDLGTLGGTNSEADSINDRGVVVGWAETTTGDKHAFLWTPEEGMVDLGTLGGSESRAHSINNRRQVVGFSYTAEDVRHAFLWTPEEGMVDLGTLGGDESGAFSINRRGVVVGWSQNTEDFMHACLWTPKGGMVDLGTLGGTQSWAYGINDRGVVVGYSWNAEMTEKHAFLWTPEEGMVDLGTLGGDYGHAFGINNRVEVVGQSEIDGELDHAFLWTPEEGMVDLGTLGGTYSGARSINDRGVVVGWGDTAPVMARHACLWTPKGGMVDLGTLVGVGPGTYSSAYSINRRGVVVGVSKTATDAYHAVLWK